MQIASNNLYKFAEEDAPSSDSENQWNIIVIDSKTTNQSFYKILFNKFSFKNKTALPCYVNSLSKAEKYIQSKNHIPVIIIDCASKDLEPIFNFIKIHRDIIKGKLIKVILVNVNDKATLNDSNKSDINGIIKQSDFNQFVVTSTIIFNLQSHLDLLELENNRKNLNNIIEATNRFVPRMFLKLLNKESIADINVGSRDRQIIGHRKFCVSVLLKISAADVICICIKCSTSCHA